MNRLCLKMWRDSPSRLGEVVDRGGILPILLLERSETGKLNDLCSSLVLLCSWYCCTA